MRYTPEQVLSLLAEVDAAAIRAVGPHPDLTIGERLDLWNHVDKLRSNRYDVLAQAYRELLAHTPDVQQKWLRDEHHIDIAINTQAIGSQEIVYVYEVTHLPKTAGKRWVQDLVRHESYSDYPGGYSGGWGTYEEALGEAIKFAITLIEKP